MSAYNQQSYGNPNYPSQPQPYPGQPQYPQQQPQYPGQQQQQPGGFYGGSAEQSGGFYGGSSHQPPPPAYSVPIQNNYVESQSPKYESGSIQDQMSGFDDKSVRRGFIRKVYSILMLQLVVTGAIMALFMYVEKIKDYVQDNMWVMYASWGVSFACIIVLACCGDVRRKSPGNFICLGVFTLCESFMLGTIATFYDTEAVLIAVGITAAVTLALTLFAFQTKIDFTGCGAVLLCILVIFVFSGMLFGIFSAMGRMGRGAQIGYAAVGCLIFSLYLIYDTQIMLGGKHKYSLSPEEYIFAALNLYLDIINLFLYILSIFGNSK